MNFLNVSLAFGAAAFSIPLIIHILNRSRFRTVEWGAMHLLESVIRVNHKRFHLEQLILLLVRCAIPVLLALCLARPVLTGSRLLNGDAPVSVVILLDTSYSMEAVGEAGSRFDQAVEAAVSVVRAAGRGSEVAVILTGGRPVPLFDRPVFDPDTVVRRLKLLQAGYGASNMATALEEAVLTLSSMSHARRELVVISDFQPADWEPVASAANNLLRPQLAAMGIPPELTLLPVGTAVSGNVALEALSYPNRALGVDQPLAVRASVRNYSSDTSQNARLVMRIDGTESSVSQVELAPNSSTQTLFTCEFDTPGSHVMEVEVVTDDPLRTDNRLAAAVTIWDNMKVLLVDGDPSSQPLKGETDFLAVALTPFTFGRVRLSDLVETQAVAPKEISADLLKSGRVIVLANVSKLEADQLSALSEWVRNGGALLICAGNRLDLSWYNDNMFSGGTGLLPCAFGATRGKPDEAGRSAHIVPQHFDHPALEFFNDPAHGDLSTAEIRQWFELVPGSDENMTAVREGESSESTRPGTIVMARLDNGDPLIAERRFGDGVVIQTAIPCDADWSDLPMRPFFVPLMQQLVTTMASGLLPPRNIATGDPAVALLPAAETETTLSVTTPDGARRTLRSVAQGNVQLARFEETQRPGIYAMTTPSAESIHFVAETSRAESDLQQLDKPDLAGLAERMGATVFESSSAYLEQDRLRRHGQEIWKYVLVALLLFMFLELFLQQRFARVRT